MSDYKRADHRGVPRERRPRRRSLGRTRSLAPDDSRPKERPRVHDADGVTRDGDRLLVYASQGGSPEHPDWYLNLVANPKVTVEAGGKRYDALAKPLEGDERDREFAAQAKRWPQFADYQEETDRDIPVVALTWI